jgi:hypothetical protein
MLQAGLFWVPYPSPAARLLPGEGKGGAFATPGLADEGGAPEAKPGAASTATTPSPLQRGQM